MASVATVVVMNGLKLDVLATGTGTNTYTVMDAETFTNSAPAGNMNGYSSDVSAVTSPAAAIEAQEQSLAREALQNLAAQLWAAGHTRTWYRESKYTKTNPSGQAPAADTSSNTGVSMTNANNGYIAPTLTVTRSGGHIQVRAYVNCPSGGTYTIHYPVVNGTIVGGTTTWIQG